jgi:hypothetical protein
MNKNMQLLQAIVGDIVREPAPDKLLEGEEAVRWINSPQFAFALVTGSGERVGIMRNGAVAAGKLASSLAKTHPQYHRGAHPRNLTTAIARTAIEAFAGRVAASIDSADLTALEKNVSEWFAANVVPRKYLVPCSIIPDHAPSFAIGPVTFCHLSDFLEQKGIRVDNQKDNIVYGPLLQAMGERYATWIAEVEIDGCEEARASAMADLAVDVALVGIQMVIPLTYSRAMARITGRTMPAWIGNVHTSASQTSTAIHRRDAGLGFSGGAFDSFRSKQTAILESIGRRVEAYVRGCAKLKNLQQAWCDAAYWFHEGLAEPLDTIAVAKLETAIEALLAPGSTKLSNARLCQAIQAFYGLKKTDRLGTNASITVEAFVKEIVGARSQILHGTFSTLTQNVSVTRGNVEGLSFDLLRLSSLAIDQYSTLTAPEDNAREFLDWIDGQRQAVASADHRLGDK